MTLVWLQPQVFRWYFFNSCNFQGNVKAFRLTRLLRWQKLTDPRVRFDSGAIFSTNHNSLLCIVTNAIASFCIDHRLRQRLAFASFWNILKQKKALLYKTHRFHVAVRMFSNRSQKTSKFGRNTSDTLGYASSATSLVLTTFFASSVIYYRIEARQHGSYLLNRHILTLIDRLWSEKRAKDWR